MQDHGKTPGTYRRNNYSLKPGQARQLGAKTLMEMYPRLGAGLKLFIIRRAWCNASGCGDCTRDLRYGEDSRTVYVTLTSSLRASVVRFQIREIIGSMNSELAQNELLRPYTETGALVRRIVVK